MGCGAVEKCDAAAVLARRIRRDDAVAGRPAGVDAICEFHQVLGNLVRNFNITETYVDEDYPWSGMLAAAAFETCSTTNRLKGYSPGQFVFGRDMILPKNTRWIGN